MAEITEYRISDLTAAASLNDSDSLEISQEDAGELTGHISKRTTMLMIANRIATIAQYTSSLQTTSKTLTGAINELKGLISLIPQFSIQVVNSLPVSDISTTTIYLTPSSNPETQNAYDEFIYVNNTWEQVGTTAADLSAYYTKTETDTLLSAKANASDVTTALESKENISDLDDDVTDIIVALTDEQTTAPGNPVTLTTVQEGGAKSALVTFAPKQSGTGDPSPSNIRPISGWDSVNLVRTGKNKLDDTNSAISGANMWYYGNGNTYKFWKAGTYTFSYEGNSATTYYTLKDGSNTTIITTLVDGRYKGNFTLAQDGYYRFFTQKQPSISADDVKKTMITLSTADQTYTAYQGETHTATFPDTVYGGSYDFVSGKIKLTHAFIDIATANWEYSSNRFNLVILNAVGYDGNNYCSCYKKSTYNTLSDSQDNLSFVCRPTGLYIKDTNYTDTTAFRNAMTGQKFVYQLETPQEITLTPADVNLLKGSNTVWTDGDTVQIKYSELPNGNLGAVIDYIKKLEARIAALES